MCICFDSKLHSMSSREEPKLRLAKETVRQ